MAAPVVQIPSLRRDIFELIMVNLVKFCTSLAYFEHFVQNNQKINWGQITINFSYGDKGHLTPIN
jgi:hypothetical protein